MFKNLSVWNNSGMWKLFSPKRDLLHEMVVHQIVTLTSVRKCLANLRADRKQEAITDLESFLDTLVHWLSLRTEECDTMTRNLMKEELRRVRQYRDANKED